jgi:hypothetical protein
MQDPTDAIHQASRRELWNKGNLIGAIPRRHLWRPGSHPPKRDLPSHKTLKVTILDSPPTRIREISV